MLFRMYFLLCNFRFSALRKIWEVETQGEGQLLRRGCQFIMMWPCECVSCLCWRAGGIVAGGSLTVYSMCDSGTGLHCVRKSLGARLHKQGTAVLIILGTCSVLNIRTSVWKINIFMIELLPLRTHVLRAKLYLKVHKHEIILNFFLT
jgi:hypothetical protein